MKSYKYGILKARFKSQVCAPLKLSTVAENCVLQVLQFQKTGVSRKYAGRAGMGHYR
jgi:hypothetical protein